ncbi:MAG: hypothetical protein KGR48_08470 [Alphaproteobacteria bacterium]|nr:hypothetical protein [Alphaproteobacteria bacterium]MBU6472473.1 hypothetical protein [Alphaproteobacteria bacterium]MDE2012794.1 hypothetical protein [Alphaproteobacteria bacterium]MDE2074650.1 hypothetical protein [Alphaproteobacteria bacterium]MDE2351291.1 hypothetical protein [Alphaproteobacteria bacterium]
MKLRNLSVAIVGLAGIGLLATLPAGAAVTVMGKGLAQSCYQAAEFNLNPADGIATCSTALEEQALTPRDRASTYVNRGILRARVDNGDGALDDYNTAIALMPDLAEAYVDRAADFIARKDYHRALADLNKGLAMGAKAPEIAYYDRAVVDEALGDIRGAYEDYKKAVAIEPHFALAIEQLKRFKVVRRPAKGI